MTTGEGHTDMTTAFSRTAAVKRIRALAATQWRTTKGYRIEISDLNGVTESLRHLSAKHCQHHAEFRVMLSCTGRDAELRDMFRMNIGDADTPAWVVRS